MQNDLAHEIDLLKLYIDKPDRLDVDENPFASNEARTVYQALLDVYTDGASINVRNVARAVRDYDASVSVKAIGDIFHHEADPESFDFYKKRIKEESLKRDLDEHVSAFRREISRKGKLDLDSLRGGLSKIESTIDDNQRETALITASEFIGDFQKDVNLRLQGKSFYATGDKRMDEYMTYGFAPGSMTTLFSASGIGKTQFKLHLLNQRINLFKPTLSVELEMENAPLAERLVCMRKQIPYWRYHPKGYHTAEGEEDSLKTIEQHLLNYIEEEKRRLKKTNRFFAVNEASLSIDDLKSLVREAKKRMGVDYLTVFIDLTTMLQDFNQGSGDSTADRYSKAVDKLHVLTREENIHIFNIVQANREMVTAKIKNPEDIENIKPQPRHVKNSSAFEERSRALIGLNRQKYFLEQFFPGSPEEVAAENIMEAIFLKQNGGPLGKIEYVYAPETYTLARRAEPKDDRSNGEDSED